MQLEKLLTSNRIPTWSGIETRSPTALVGPVNDVIKRTGK